MKNINVFRLDISTFIDVKVSQVYFGHDDLDALRVQIYSCRDRKRLLKKLFGFLVAAEVMPQH